MAHNKVEGNSIRIFFNASVVGRIFFLVSFFFLFSYSVSFASGEVATSSLMFDSTQSQYLTRTAVTPTDNKKWTYSTWVKRGQIGTGVHNSILGAYTDGNNYASIYFGSGDMLVFKQVSGGVNAPEVDFTPLFRDPSAWYHVVVVYDSANTIQSHRVRAYVNNVELIEQTLYGSESQNQASLINSAIAHTVGRYAGGSNYHDGYLSDAYFVDGQALNPTSFGQADSNTGNWIPKSYAGTYGTNGFHMKFSSSTALGADSSGNGNNWTTNGGMSSTTNQVIDTPLNNFATLNPIDMYQSAAITTFKDGNLRADANNIAQVSYVRSSMAMKGPTYFEWTLNSWSNSSYPHVGIRSINEPMASPPSDGIRYSQDGTINNGGGNYTLNGASLYTALSTNDKGMIAFDPASGKIWMGRNGIWFNSGDPANGTGYVATFPANGEYTPYIQLSTDSTTFNFGQRPFTYTPPTGFKSLSTANLPTPTILKPNQHFDIVKYYAETSNGTYSTGTLAFKPDFTWIKNRDNVESHYLIDIVRGNTNMTNKFLSSNSTGAEGAGGVSGTTFSVTPTGYEFTESSIGAGELYYSGRSYVGWNWKAGNATTTNTDGTITSTVSTNPTAGFSIVSYTGTGANATVGHGLGSSPTMIILKNRTDASTPWAVWHSGISNTEYLYLNSTNAKATGVNLWNSTSSTPTTFSVGSSQDTNYNTKEFIAYAFSEVPGYSKFGTYTGNGSTDGPFLYTGFKPRYIMIKRTDAAGYSWDTYDTSRSTYNPLDLRVYADSSSVEVSAGGGIDSVSNGFKIRTAGNYDINYSGGTYIYAAFAETTMLPTAEDTFPSVSTPIVVSVLDTSATFGATLDSAGDSPVTARGICYGTSPAPTNCVADSATTTGAYTKSIAGLSTSTTYYFRGYATNARGTSYSSDGSTMTLASVITLAPHTLNQVTNTFTSTNKTNTELFAFNLSSGDADVTGIAFDLQGIQGVETGDLTNFALYEDTNNDKTHDGGDIAVGGSGTPVINGQTGTITFGTTFNVSTDTDYILVGDISDIKVQDSMTVSLIATDITSTASVVATTSPTNIQHIRLGKASEGGGGGGGFSKQIIGTEAPAGDGIQSDGSENGNGGSSIDPNTGSTIGNEPGFNAPSNTGTPYSAWTAGANAYSSDGVYTTTSASNQQSYGNFNFTVPSNNQITGIAVKLEASGSTAAGNISVKLSWDGGSSVTALKTTGTMGLTDAIYALGGPSDTWGHSWTPAELNNGLFTIELIANPSGNTIQLDAVQVKVFYQATGGGRGGGGMIYNDLEPKNFFANVYSAVGCMFGAFIDRMFWWLWE
ncbi:MAG: hypothetical protein K9M10_00645 [Candidatus Pacebacteria bacterium]|nr:hypothetical protein [Candidatus Paceibacterota bacterium]